jgi:precorrin-2 dehydrogenase/sirohydrochlorin ferrochelatase
MGWLPVLLKLDGLKALVLGGGRQGAKRALQLAEAGARVKVAAREFNAELLRASEEGVVELVRVDLDKQEVLESLIKWANLVVIATSDPEVNERARGIALRLGRLVNDITSAGAGNLVVPFHAETSYGLVIAISTLGKAGVAARVALEKCLEALESDWEVKVIMETLGRLKPWLKRVEPDHTVRMRVYRALASDAEYRRLAREDLLEEALRRALEIAKSITGSACGQNNAGEPGRD